MAVEGKRIAIRKSEEVKDGESKGEVVINIKDDETSNSNSHSDSDEKTCRICLESSSQEKIIALGCDCKGDLGFAHESCAASWFSIKRSRECEICGKTAANMRMSAVRELVLREITEADDGYDRRYAEIGGYLLLTFIASLTFFYVVYIPLWRRIHPDD